MPKLTNHSATKTKTKNIQLKEAKYEALTIAKFLFSLDPKREYFRGDKKISTGAGFSNPLLGNWRLSQMLYLLQVFHYVKYGYFLFKDDLYAFDNGFFVYDAYRNFWALHDKAWFLNEAGNIQDKETKDFIRLLFNYFKNYSNKGLEEWYTNDPSWIEAWMERKKEPKIEFDPKTLSFYDNFLDNHLHHIEHHARL